MKLWVDTDLTSWAAQHSTVHLLNHAIITLPADSIFLCYTLPPARLHLEVSSTTSQFHEHRVDDPVYVYTQSDSEQHYGKRFTCTVDSTYKEPCYKELLLIKNNFLGPSLFAYIFLCYNKQTPVIKNSSLLPVTFKWDLKWILCS